MDPDRYVSGSSLDQIKTISGDPNIYGQVYVGFAGSGYAYLPATTTTPTVAVSINNTDVNVANGTGTVTFAFSAAPATFVLADTSAVGGTLSNLQKTDATHYTATFTGSANTDIANASVSVTAGSWQGNGTAGAGGSTPSFTVDTVTPTVAVAINSTDVNLAHNTATVTFTFSEAPTSFGLSDVTYSGGTLGSLTQVNPTTYTALFTAAANTDISTAQVSVTANSWSEVNSNPGSGGSTPSFTVDTVTPTVAVAINSTDVNLAHNTATVTFTFSEAPTSFGLSDVTYSGGTLGSLTQVNPTTYTALFTAAANTDISTAQVSVTANSWSEVNSNPGSGGSTPSFTVDTVTPTVAVSTNNTDVTVANPTGTVTFAFSEAPVTFVLADTSAVGGTLSNLQKTDATHYTATFTGAANTNISTASVSVTAGSWQEGNGNAGAGGSTAAFTVNTVTVTPTVAVSINNTDVNVANGTGTVTFAFSAAPATFVLADTSAVGGTLSNLQKTDATHYTATFTGSANTDIANASVSVTAGSWQGNGTAGAGGSTPSFTVDTVTPTVAVAINSTDVNLAHNTATVTFTFSEAPTSFGLSDVTYSGGTLGSLTQVNPTTYTALFTAAANTDISTAQVSVTANSWSEVNSNPGSGGSTPSFTVDTVTPTVAVAINSTDVNLAHNTATVTFTFSEAPTSFGLSDVTYSGGTLGSLTQVNPTTYTALFTAAANTDISTAQVSVTANSWSEVNSNPGSGGSTPSFTVDTVTPTVAVSTNNTDVTVANPTGTVTFAFSEAPVTFVLADTSAVGGTLSNLQKTDATHYTATFTGAANTNISTASVSVTAGSWQEGNGNAGAGGSTAAFTVNTVTVTPTVAVSINNTDVNVANGTGTVTFAFSAAPATFVLADTSAVGGTLSNLQKTDATHYTATFTGSANTDIANASVSVTAGSWQEQWHCRGGRQHSQLHGGYGDADGGGGDQQHRREPRPQHGDGDVHVQRGADLVRAERLTYRGSGGTLGYAAPRSTPRPLHGAVHGRGQHRYQHCPGQRHRQQLVRGQQQSGERRQHSQLHGGYGDADGGGGDQQHRREPRPQHGDGDVHVQRGADLVRAERRDL